MKFHITWLRAFPSSRLLITLGFVLLSNLLVANSAHAVDFNVSNEAEFRAAIATASNNGSNDRIFLRGSTITLTYDPVTGTGGTVVIEDDAGATLDIIGNGGTIRRAPGDELFRLFHVRPLTVEPVTSFTGSVEFRAITLTGGRYDASSDVNNVSGGGAIFAERRMLLLFSEFSDNRVIGNGNGGAVLASAFVNSTGNVYRDNSADVLDVGAASGGAIAVSPGGRLSNVDDQYLDNSATNGGAIFLELGSDTASIGRSTFENNTADSLGGAVFNRASGSSGFLNQNTTYVGNQAGVSGGAIYSQSTQRVTLAHLTVVNNSAINGGGIIAEGTTASPAPTLTNLILADNVGGNCAAIGSSLPLNISPLSSGNIVTDETCGSSGVIALADSSGLFSGGLTNNGGRTPTIALAANSPAIDAGSECVSLQDQRVVARPDGGIADGFCDAGAFEVDRTVADSDGDGVADTEDAFPNDPNESADSDGDGVGDNADAFPDDASETADTDSDGVGNNSDAFPDDPDETVDTDSDGVGDNSDEFPDDPNESADTDGDGVGDNADVFPNDASETVDTDDDGVGDNADEFPNDASESVDTDGDGVGDNADAFPNDASETVDTDGDGVGDNADAFPNDPTRTEDTDTDTDASGTAPDPDSDIVLANGNDFFTPGDGGGFIVSYRINLTDADVSGLGQDRWIFEPNYTGSGTIINAWASGFNGPIDRGNLASDGEFAITSSENGFRPSLNVGNSIVFFIQVDNAGLNNADFTPVFTNLTAGANAGAGGAASGSSDVAADFTASNLNSWYNAGSGGFNVALNVVLTAELLANQDDFGWTIQLDYSGNGQITNGWMNGFPGGVSIDRQGNDVIVYSNETQGFQPSLSVGDVISMSVQINNAPFDAADFDLTFSQ